MCRARHQEHQRRPAAPAMHHRQIVTHLQAGTWRTKDASTQVSIQLRCTSKYLLPLRALSQRQLTRAQEAHGTAIGQLTHDGETTEENGLQLIFNRMRNGMIEVGHTAQHISNAPIAIQQNRNDRHQQIPTRYNQRYTQHDRRRGTGDVREQDNNANRR